MFNYEKNFNGLHHDEKYAFNEGYFDGFECEPYHPSPVLIDAYNAGYYTGQRDRLDEDIKFYGLSA